MLLLHQIRAIKAGRSPMLVLLARAKTVSIDAKASKHGRRVTTAHHTIKIDNNKAL
jgi:hypothetical protein